MCVMPCFIELTSVINPFRSYLAETDTDRNHRTAMEIILLYSRLEANKFEISFCIVRTLHGRLQIEVTGKQSFRSFKLSTLSQMSKSKTTRGLLICVSHNFFFTTPRVCFFFILNTHTYHMLSLLFMLIILIPVSKACK